MTTADSSLMRVLRCFAGSDHLGFTELAEKLHFDTDLAGYYLRRLQSRGMVLKIQRGTYQITPLGKSMVAHSDQLSSLSLMPRISIMLVASHDGRYVVVKRQQQPFIGKVEWPTASLELGMALPEAAAAVAKQRFDLPNTQPTLHGMFRRIDKHAGTIFDDKLFAVHTLALTAGQLADLPAQNSIGELQALATTEIEALPNAAKSLQDILAFSKASKSYAEQSYHLSDQDLYTS